MVIKTKAIVLHAFKFGENKMMIDLLTEQQGRVTFAARISNSPRAKVKKQYFQPFAVLDVEYDYRQKATIQTFIHVGIAYPLGSIPFDSYKLSISFFLAELTAYATRDEQTNAPLFNYIVSSIEWLDSCGTTFSNFHLVYIVHLLRFLGFYPNLEAMRKGVILTCAVAATHALCPHIATFSPRQMLILWPRFRAWIMPTCTFLRCRMPTETASVKSF